MESKGVMDNFLTKGTWIRGLYMVLFVVFYSIAEILVTAVVVFQFLHVLFTGRQNERLLSFGNSLSIYVYEMMSFFTYNSEEKPYPFGEWPVEEESTEETE
jgi:hypothetical protein